MTGLDQLRTELFPKRLEWVKKLLLRVGLDPRVFESFFIRLRELKRILLRLRDSGLRCSLAFQSETLSPFRKFLNVIERDITAEKSEI
jgi:hypothetical protein